MLTRHGWAAVVAAVVAAVTGRVFGVLELYVLAAGLLGVAVVSLVVVNGGRPDIHVRRVARPAVVAVGEAARVDVRLENQGRRRTPRLRLWEPVGPRGGAPMQVAPLRGGQSSAAAYRVPTTRRGIVAVGPMRTERTDLLGLARRRRTIPGRAEITVVPERVPLAFPSLGSNGSLGQHLRMKAMGRSGTEFHSQREYVPGDDLRRINWKSSARSGTLIVREPALEGVRHCTVVLDTEVAGYDADGFERAVSAAASVVSAAANDGTPCRMVAPGLDLRGPDMVHEALRWLALVQPGDRTVERAAIAGAHADGLALIVVITSALGAPSELAATSAAGPEDTVVVVTAMPDQRSQRRFGVDASSLQELERNWRHLVGWVHA